MSSTASKLRILHDAMAHTGKVMKGVIELLNNLNNRLTTLADRVTALESKNEPKP